MDCRYFSWNSATGECGLKANFKRRIEKVPLFFFSDSGRCVWNQKLIYKSARGRVWGRLLRPGRQRRQPGCGQQEQQESEPQVPEQVFIALNLNIFHAFLKKLKSIENRFKLMSDGRCYLVVKSPKKYESARSEFCYRQHLFPRINIVIFNKKICRRSCAGLGASLATPLQAESAHMLMKLGTNCISLKINKHYIFLFASAWLSAEQLLGFPHDRPGGWRRGVQRRVKHFPQKILLINNITVPCF